jgi:hypothetical protein
MNTKAIFTIVAIVAVIGMLGTAAVASVPQAHADKGVPKLNPNPIKHCSNPNLPPGGGGPKCAS